MNSAVLSIQHSYSIYAGDFHLHALGDYGPFQNPAFSAGYEHSGLRSIISQSVTPSYLERLMSEAHQVVQRRMQSQEITRGVRFTGIVGLGDYFDMACSQEGDMLMRSAAHLAGIDPDLRFTMMVPGNHDGGQYMGSLWSKDNLFGLPFVGGHDWRQGACGCGNALSVADRIAVTREVMGRAKTITPVTFVAQADSSGFTTLTGHLFSFDQPDRVFDQTWKQTSDADCWECVIHYGKNISGGGAHRNQGVCSPSTSLESPDAQEWFHLQARLQETFTLPDGTTVPVYQIGLDTQDLTTTQSWHPSIYGHVSPLQIRLVENFMASRLKQNPNAKFKLVTHYPMNALASAVQRNIRSLLDRDDVISVISGHRHQREFVPDLRADFNLSRRTTPLPQVTSASITDQPSEVLIEEMFLRPKTNGEYMLVQKFSFVNPLEGSIDSNAQIWYDRLVARLNKYWASLGRIPERDVLGLAKYPLIGNEWVLHNGPDDLRMIAGKRTSRVGQIANALKMLARHGRGLSDYLVVNGSIPQMVADFHVATIFIDTVCDSLKDEGQHLLADQLSGLLLACRQRYEQWKVEYTRAIREKRPNAECVDFNNLFARTGLQDCVNFLNDSIPAESVTQAFMLKTGQSAGLQSSAFYRDYGREQINTVPSQVTVVQGYRAHSLPNRERYPHPATGQELLAMAK